MNNILRGSVWMVDLEPVRGHEQGRKRPCLIISENMFNSSAADLVVVIPLTSKFRPLNWFIQIDPPEGGLAMRSYIITNQIRTITKDRLGSKCLGNVSSSTLKQVEQRLQFLLNLQEQF